jgi:hypothetical protein
MDCLHGSHGTVGIGCQLLVGIPANFPNHERDSWRFWQKTTIGTALEKDWTRIDGVSPNIRKKGD